MTRFTARVGRLTLPVRDLLRLPRRRTAVPAADPPWVRRARRLVAAGLIDVEWCRAQLPDLGWSPEQVAQHYVRTGWRDGLTPNPLFLPQWTSGTGGTLAVGELLRRLSAGHSPAHPLFDPAHYVRAHPQATSHPGGPLGHFLSCAGPEDPMPLRDRHLRCPPWGRTRELLLHTVRRVARERGGACDPAVRERDPQEEAAWRAESDAWPGTGQEVVVSVLVSASEWGTGLAELQRQLTAQQLRSWELVVVDDRAQAREPLIGADGPGEPSRVVVVPAAGAGEGAARLAATRAASGKYLAFLGPGCRWEPDFLRRATATMERHGHHVGLGALAGPGGDGGADGVRAVEYAYVGLEDLLALDQVEMSTVVLDRQAVIDAGGFDDALPSYADWDLLLRLAAEAAPTLLPSVVATRTQPTDRRRPAASGWREHVLARHLLDWSELAQRPRVPGRVSVLVPTFDDWLLTARAVGAVLARSDHPDLEVVVVDNGSGSLARQMLSVLLTDLPGVHLERLPDNTHFALGSDVAFARSTGHTVVFLNNDTTVTDGWLQPLLDELGSAGVNAVQPLLLYPDGTVQSAGVVFPRLPGLPVNFLVGHPAEDATRLGTFATFAVTGAAMVMRASTVLDARGFDPLFSNGWEDVDLCLRAGVDGVRGTRVVTSSTVLHLESGGNNRLIAPHNRRLFLDRWAGRLPSGPEPLWARAGFEVPHLRPDAPVHGMTDGSSRVARPLVVRSRSRSDADLRWAIKIAAPAGAPGDVWGDTHFAKALAAALARLGQTVAVDRLQAHQRPSSYLDDVTLVLRGLEPFVVQPGRVNLMWVISHPNLVTADELGEYDKVFAAGPSWARAVAESSGVEVEPLLQATDPALFNPQRGVADTSCQALFVGSSRNVERRIVRDAIRAGLDVAIFGPNWSQFFPGASFVHDAVPNEQVGPLYRSAGVVLNDHWEDMAAHGFVSNRLFDAVASGARVVSDAVDGLAELFEGAVQVYNGPDDLRELVVGGLADRFPDEQERVRIATRVGKEHSFDVRAAELLRVARVLHAGQ